MLLKCAIGIFSCFHIAKVTRNSDDGMEVFLVSGKVPVGFKVYVGWCSEIIWCRKGYRPFRPPPEPVAKGILDSTVSKLMGQSLGLILHHYDSS